MAKTISKAEDKRRRAVIDELGRLDSELAAAGFEKKKKRVEALRAEVRTWANAEAKPEDAALYEGDEYTATATARGEERKIVDFPKLFKLLTPKRFFELCSIPLKAIDDALTATDRAAVLTEDRTGTRRISTVRRSVPAA